MDKSDLLEILEFAYSQNPLSMAVFDMDMRYIYASKQWYEQYELGLIDLVGKNHYEIFPEILNMPEWIEAHKQVLNGETLEKDRDQFIRSDGSIQYQRWVMSPWYIPGTNKQGGAFIFTEDITRQVELEDEKNQLIDQLKVEVTQRKVAEKQLTKLAITDELTGLNNRRQINYLLEEEIKRAERYNNELSLLEIDIDHFKSINDNFGHDVVDQILKSFAQLLSEFNRDTDKVGRWGGEEFLAILPHVDEGSALLLANRLRKKVVSESFPTVEQLTVSIGIATFQKGDTAGSLIKRADEALYVAKNKGRNRVEADNK